MDKRNIFTAIMAISMLITTFQAARQIKNKATATWVKVMKAIDLRLRI